MSNQAFATVLRTDMKAENVTSAILAKITGIAKSTIDSYRAGRSAPGIKNLALLDNALSGSDAAKAKIDEVSAALTASAKAGKTRGARNKGVQGEIFERYFEGLPVRDASIPTRVNVLPEDFDPDARKEPAHCLLANACRRAFGSKAVVFFRTVAYVELVEEDGERVVERFNLPQTTRNIVASYDKGEDVPTDGRLVTLEPPSPGKSLEHMRKAKRAQRKGEYKSEANRARARKAAKTRAEQEPIDVRDGGGQWQMVPAR